MRAGAAEARLDFVRDAQPPGGADVLIGILEVIVRKNHATADALNRFSDKRRDHARGCEIEDVLHVVRIFFPASASSRPHIPRYGSAWIA